MEGKRIGDSIRTYAICVCPYAVPQEPLCSAGVQIWTGTKAEAIRPNSILMRKSSL